MFCYYSDEYDSKWGFVARKNEKTN
jgi:hypothetical protein